MSRVTNVFAIILLNLSRDFFFFWVTPCFFCVPAGSEALHAGEGVRRGGFRRRLLPRIESGKLGGLTGAAG